MAKLNTLKGRKYMNEINEDDTHNKNRLPNSEDEISLEIRVRFKSNLTLYKKHT